MRERTFDGAAFRSRRLDLHLTQEQAADRAGVSLSFLKLIEKGTTQPSDPFAAVLADAVDRTPEQLSTPKSRRARPAA